MREEGEKMKIDKHLKITMTRSQVCDLLIAVEALRQGMPKESKWHELHDELWKLLEDWDTVAAINEARKDTVPA